MSDPFSFDEPFAPLCPVCGSPSCSGCFESERKKLFGNPVVIIGGVIGGIAVGLTLGFLAFSGSSNDVGPSTVTPQPSATVIDENTTTTITATSTFSPANQDEELMLSLVNEVRQENGTGNVTWCPALVRSSRAHSEDMSVQNYFDHASPDGGTIGTRASDAGYKYKTVGENIAFGQRDVKEVMEAWIDSPGHFENLISSNFEHFGYAQVDGRLDGSPGKFWTQNFGAGGDCA